jgi:ammonium transporter Rh
MIGGE